MRLAPSPEHEIRCRSGVQLRLAPHGRGSQKPYYYCRRHPLAAGLEVRHPSGAPSPAATEQLHGRAGARRRRHQADPLAAHVGAATSQRSQLHPAVRGPWSLRAKPVSVILTGRSRHHSAHIAGATRPTPPPERFRGRRAPPRSAGPQRPVGITSYGCDRHSGPLAVPQLEHRAPPRSGRDSPDGPAAGTRTSAVRTTTSHLPTPPAPQVPWDSLCAVPPPRTHFMGADASQPVQITYG